MVRSPRRSRVEPVSTPRVSILILTRNAGSGFASTLEALFAARGIDGAEVLVVDSGSEDRTLDIAGAYPGVRVHCIEPQEFGHGRTRNLAAAMSRGEVLVFLVQDAVPVGEDWLEQLLEPFVDRSVAAVYGRQCPREAANPVERFFMNSVYGDEETVREVTDPANVKVGTIFFSNVFSALRRSVWNDFPFDETMIMSEDQKWARDVLLAGHRIVYRPTARVLHSHHYTWVQLFQRNFDSGYSLVGIVEDTKGEMVRDEWQFLRSGLRDLRRSGSRGWAIPFVLFEAARVSGFAAGQLGRFLPVGLRRALSMHKYHWGGRASVRSGAPRGERTNEVDG